MNPDWCFHPRSYEGGSRWCFAKSDLDLVQLLDRAASSRQSYEALYKRLEKQHGLLPKELLTGLGFLHWMIHTSCWPKRVEIEAKTRRLLELLLLPLLEQTLDRLEVAARNRLSGHVNRRTIITESDRLALGWLGLLAASHLDSRVAEVEPKAVQARRKKQTQNASLMRSREAKIRYETAVGVLEALGMRPTPALVSRTAGLAIKTAKKYADQARLEAEIQHPV